MIKLFVENRYICVYVKILLCDIINNIMHGSIDVFAIIYILCMLTIFGHIEPKVTYPAFDGIEP